MARRLSCKMGDFDSPLTLSSLLHEHHALLKPYYTSFRSISTRSAALEEAISKCVAQHRRNFYHWPLIARLVATFNGSLSAAASSVIATMALLQTR